MNIKFLTDLFFDFYLSYFISIMALTSIIAIILIIIIYGKIIPFSLFLL